ncbi:tetratricopeptide repeat protein [Saccharothrix xinjiangensis]|uniref:Tetratricopeptide repeat protein n=1 Tax=Saccharothrix xinjiangensis TaxID=204798 RepID=A0ABV9Y0H9_9PSEU
MLLPTRDRAGTDAALAGLVAAGSLHLGGPPKASRWRVPDALHGERDAADQEATADPEVTAAHERLIEHHLVRLTEVSETLEPGKFVFSEPPGAGWAPPGRPVARVWVEAEYLTVMACRRLAVDLGRDDVVWRIGERLWIPLRSAGLFDAVLDSRSVAADAADRAEHPYVPAAHSRMCWALTRLGRHGKAARVGALAVAFDHAWSRATAWSQLGRAYHAHGAPDLAVDCLRRAEAEDTLPAARGQGRRHIGEVRRSTGDLVGAEADFRAALELIVSDLRPRHPETARVLVLLAEVLVEQDRACEAVDELGEAVGLLDPDADALYLAEVELHLGHALLAHGDRAGHPRRAQDACACHDAIGGVD